MPHAPGKVEDPALPQDALESLQNLRTALGQLLSAAPGTIETPTDLRRNLGIDMTLSWKIHRVVRAPTPAAAAPNVPGMPSMRALLKAAGKCGVPQDVVEAAAEAAEAFDHIVKVHAGDRGTFQSMVSALGSSEDAERVDLSYRRAAFRSARHFWGASAKTRLVCRVVQPSQDPSQIDIAGIAGYLGLRKLRSDARLVISCTRFTYDDGTKLTGNAEALVPGADTKHGVVIVPEFCSKPLPEIRTAETPGGFVITELCSNRLGRTAAMTCITGTVSFGLPARWFVPEINEVMTSYALVRLPSELLIHDVFVREGTCAPGLPTAKAFAECGEYSDHRELETRGQAARLRASVEEVGKGPAAAYATEFPRYMELIQKVFDRLGSDGNDFTLYRCRIEYPVMPSVTLTRFDLLRRPEE